MLDAALELARSGRKVFPCWECDHKEKIDPDTGEVIPEGAKAPRTRRGFHDATTDPDQIRRWWTRWPNALIGGPVPDGHLVLDIDPRHGGSLATLAAALGPLPGTLPGTLTVWSGRNDGGMHLYFRVMPGRFTDKLLRDRGAKGIDLRVGGRAYCILPPSLHPSTGQPYWWTGTEAAWLPPAATRALRPAPVPAWHKAAPGSPKAVAGLLRVVGDAIEGERNRALYWAGCRAAEKGVLDEALVAELVAASRLPDREARRTLESARRAAGRVA